MKKLNINLINYIIKTDFFILENKKLKNFKLVNLTSNKNLFILDVIELNYLLKQFIRVLQFTKKKNFLINFLMSNKQYLQILKTFFIKNKTLFRTNMSFHNNILKNSLSFNYLQLYLFINIKDSLKRNFLTSEICCDKELFNRGNYKIFNNLNSFKKLIFFMSILHNILKYKN